MGSGRFVPLWQSLPLVGACASRNVNADPPAPRFPSTGPICGKESKMWCGAGRLQLIWQNGNLTTSLDWHYCRYLTFLILATRDKRLKVIEVFTRSKPSLIGYTYFH